MSTEPRLKRIERLERRSWKSVGRRIRLNLLAQGTKRRKLDEDQVRQVKRWLAEGVMHKEIGRRVGVSPRTITNIAGGSTWGWVQP